MGAKTTSLTCKMGRRANANQTIAKLARRAARGGADDIARIKWIGLDVEVLDRYVSIATPVVVDCSRVKREKRLPDRHRDRDRDIETNISDLETAVWSGLNFEDGVFDHRFRIPIHRETFSNSLGKSNQLYH